MDDTDSTPQRPIGNPLRARLARMAQVQLITGWIAPQGSRLVTIATPAGDEWTGDEDAAHAYLSGLAHGAWATHKNPSAGRPRRGAAVQR